MSATTKDMSALQMSVRYGISENTARLFMYKVGEAMKSDEKDGMKGTVYELLSEARNKTNRSS